MRLRWGTRRRAVSNSRNGRGLGRQQDTGARRVAARPGGALLRATSDSAPVVRETHREEKKGEIEKENRRGNDRIW